MSRLTFNIDEGAALVGVKRARPWTSLRAKLFGIETDHAGVPGRFVATEERNPQNLVRRFSAARMAPLVPGIAPPRPARIAAAAPISLLPKSSGHRTLYKGRLIIASQSGDGSWTAIHAPLGADPSAFDLPAQDTHRFMARVLAIASAQIEIDDLESRAG